MGILYVVATPIGNLEDLTFRADRILRSVGVVVAEDSRRTLKLLNHLGVTKKVITYHAESPESRQDAIIERLGRGDIALVSDAGTPGISDPGPDLIGRARAEGFDVVPVPGPSAVTAALSVVSFARQPVGFIGFLPERRARRERLVRGARQHIRTLVIYLPPHRVSERVKELLDWLGEVPAALCREMTKLHEEVFEASLADVHAHLAGKRTRGEITLVLDVGEPMEAQVPDRAELESAIVGALAKGQTPSEAAASVARALGVSKRTVYEIATGLRRAKRS